METTVAHIVLERLKEKGVEVNYPDDVKGDLLKEHNWLLFNGDGPLLMTNHKKLFENVCQEVDHAIAEGVAYFSDSGIITMNM